MPTHEIMHLGHRAVAGRASHLSAHDGVREPADGCDPQSGRRDNVRARILRAPTNCSRSSRSARTSAPARMSGGEQQMLAIARALMGRPRLAAARRTVARACAADRQADLRCHQGTQRARRADRVPCRAERLPRPEARASRLRHGQRRHHDDRAPATNCSTAKRSARPISKEARTDGHRSMTIRLDSRSSGSSPFVRSAGWRCCLDDGPRTCAGQLATDLAGGRLCGPARACRPLPALCFGERHATVPALLSDRRAHSDCVRDCLAIAFTQTTRWSPQYPWLYERTSPLVRSGAPG